MALLSGGGGPWSWWEALFFSLPLDPQGLGAATTLEGHRMPTGEWSEEWVEKGWNSKSRGSRRQKLPGPERFVEQHKLGFVE